MDLTIKKIKTDNLPLQDEGDSSSKPVSPADNLCEDELSLILSNVVISTRDLFNFRLVNKSWCDAATSTLLRRDASYVPLGMRNLPYDHEDGSEPRALFCKLGIQTKRTNNIKKLGTVMSNSKRFPSSSFHVYLQVWAFKSLIDSPGFIPFLERHGKNIKTLSLHGYWPSDFSFDVLLVYTPYLKCLNLSEAGRCELEPEDKMNNYTNHVASSSSLTLKTLPIQSVFLGCSPFSPLSHEMVHELLSFPPKLISIENVTLETFPLVLNEEKGSLIRSFLLKDDKTTTDFNEYESVVEQLAGMNPTLSTVTLDFRNTNFYLATLNSINEILHSSKDNLENLRIYMGEIRPWYKLRIPPMKNLKFIKISRNSLVDGRIGMQDGLYPGYLSYWELEDSVGTEQYFPNLLKVSLEFVCAQDHDAVLPLFQFKSYPYEGENSVRNSLPKVETLKINSYCWPNIFKATFFQQGFPNIRFLKACWDWSDASNFNGSLWLMCPLAEVIEITGISNVMSKNVSAVDSFFTGFSRGLCRKLLETGFPVHMNNPETWKFLRTKLSILDLKHLKEFKLTFEEVPGFEFASHLTRDFAFSLMPNTKCIIAYDPELVVSRHTVPHASRHNGDENSDNESGSIGENRNRISKSGDDRNRRSRSCGSKNGNDRSCRSRSFGSENEDDRSRRSRSCDSENGDDRSRRCKSCGSKNGDDQSRRSRSCGSENGDDQNSGNESGDDQRSHSSRSCGNECGCDQILSNESRGSQSGDDRSRRSRNCSSAGGNNRSLSSSSKNFSSKSDDDNKIGNDRYVHDVESCFAFLKPYVKIIQERKIR